MTENQYQLYVRLLYETYHAHQAVDDFDLRSEDPASAAQWKVLLDEQRLADITLISHVHGHWSEIIQIIELNHDSYRNSPPV